MVFHAPTDSQHMSGIHLIRGKSQCKWQKASYESKVDELLCNTLIHLRVQISLMKITFLRLLWKFTTN